MNYHDTPGEAIFRAQVRTFIETEAPKNMARGEGGYGGAGEAWKAWVKKLADKHWVCPAWPEEYGGAGMSVMEQFIFNWEMAEARVPRPGENILSRPQQPFPASAEGRVPAGGCHRPPGFLSLA